MGWGLGEWGWSRDSGGRLGLWSSRLEKRLGGDGMVVRLTPEEGVPIGLGARDDTHTASSYKESPSLCSSVPCRQEVSPSGEVTAVQAGRGYMMKVLTTGNYLE